MTSAASAPGAVRVTTRPRLPSPLAPRDCPGLARPLTRQAGEGTMGFVSRYRSSPRGPWVSEGQGPALTCVAECSLAHARARGPHPRSQDAPRGTGPPGPPDTHPAHRPVSRPSPHEGRRRGRPPAWPTRCGGVTRWRRSRGRPGTLPGRVTSTLRNSPFSTRAGPCASPSHPPGQPVLGCPRPP